ncbi:glycosyltransferase family 9 protein [Hufsiella ginkgonis]|uniref:Glycosyltransferase family 9 protein n=1 Tax=Hufsiella ginkgonis TaxID=2695274 RepID=A0A7K1Y0Q6_9SPHI|nr:glycosyltransferase family 9 protein [Hufsiella ginkgonis]MXV16677.1 glycosyltransferase family 9 protein [Hufsiella ginkgonis]
MNADWTGCKNILCIRPDNMGDVLMSSPAFRALKETFDCKITLLTSPAGAVIARLIPAVDEVITCHLPWVSHPAADDSITQLISILTSKNFDGAVVFTVYSQNPLPSAMIAYLAGIPNRLAWCRENPYHLLDCWMPDPEPYQLIRHQVKRDLDLVAAIGAYTADDHLALATDKNRWPAVAGRLTQMGLDLGKPWIIIHPGVSEEKREYPFYHWIVTGQNLIKELNTQLIITGSFEESQQAEKLRSFIGKSAFSVAGTLDLEELSLLISHAPLVISVNTITSHLAAAMGCPIVVLYALTNPQHLPWRASGIALTYPVTAVLRSRNEIVRQVGHWMPQIFMVSPDEILAAAKEILTRGFHGAVPELVPLQK